MGFLGTSNKVKLDKHEAVLLDSESEDDLRGHNYPLSTRDRYTNSQMDFSDHPINDRVAIKQIGTNDAAGSILRNTNSTNVERGDSRRQYQSEDQNFRSSLANYSNPSDERAFRAYGTEEKSQEPIKPRRGVGLWTSSSSNEVSGRASSKSSPKDHTGLHRMKPKVKRSEAARVSSVDTVMGLKTNKTSSSATRYLYLLFHVYTCNLI